MFVGPSVAAAYVDAAAAQDRFPRRVEDHELIDDGSGEGDRQQGQPAKRRNVRDKMRWHIGRLG